ncbi:MAG: hypothetical protein P8R54_27540 [Myxococcota bacterium]|nr:hypothetical protein [Myxococcota bacterium]
MSRRRTRILHRLRRTLRGAAPPEPAPADTEPGTTLLPDGTLLERARYVTAEDLQLLTQHRSHPQLFIHWSSAEPACADDLPTLRELHLFWAHHVDFIAIAWELSTTTVPLQQAAAAVDAWHRDYGLTWRSLLVARSAGSPGELLSLSAATLPQVILVDAAGAVLFHRVGPLQDADRARLGLLLREKCSGSP